MEEGCVANDSSLKVDWTLAADFATVMRKLQPLSILFHFPFRAYQFVWLEVVRIHFRVIK